jgi:hypothetical protein
VVGRGPCYTFWRAVAAHWLDEPGAEASVSGSSGVAPESSVIAYGMEDVVHASTGEPYSGF